MTTFHRRSFVSMLVLACAVLCGGVGLAGAPTPGAATIDDLLAKFAGGVDGGDAAAVRSCFDTSKAHGRDYPDYVATIAAMNAGKVAALAKADQYGVRAKAEPLVAREWGAASQAYGPYQGPTDLKVGGTFYAQGLKGQIVIVKKRGVFLLDASAALEGVDRDYLKEEEARYTKAGADWSKAASAATSGDDLLARLAKIQQAS